MTRRVRPYRAHFQERANDFVKDVRIGKAIELEIDDMPKDEAEKKIEEICEKLLAQYGHGEL